MTPRGTYTAAPSLSESTVIQKAIRATQTAEPDAPPAAAIKSCLGGAHGAGKQGPKTKPSAQLVDYLNSPYSQDPYTGVAGSEGVGIVKQHKKDMEIYLHGWEKDWQKMAAAKDK